MAGKGKMAPVHPYWLDTVVPAEYEDEALYEIILFFVIHSPCPGQSASGISLTERGWKEKPWYSAKYLKDRLGQAIFGNGTRMLEMVNSKAELADKIEEMDADDDFSEHREQQRALYVKSSNKECENEYMSLFYHIRNSLAHGRLAMYPGEGKEIVFVMEDGRECGEQFEVTARIVINKSSLLRIIHVLENPPKENDYTDDILTAIDKGHCDKKSIMKELGIDEATYEQYIQKLKKNEVICCEHKKWKRI